MWNNSTVAIVRNKKLIHIGKINNIAITCGVLKSAIAMMYAAGYPSNRQIIVVIRAIPIEYIKLFRYNELVKKLTKFSIVNSPLGLVKAYTPIKTNGRATKHSKNMAYGHAHVLRDCNFIFQLLILNLGF